MKVLVFDKEITKGYISPEDREGLGWIVECVATEIDIPDGCVLAVARHKGDVICSNAAACDSDCYHKHVHRFDADLCDTAECYDTKVVVKCVPQLRVIQEVRL
jgi:hypothetical protein